MSNSDREKEDKFFIVGMTYKEAVQFLCDSGYFYSQVVKFQEGRGPDYFWDLNDKDFIRFRPKANTLEDGTVESHLTVKREDRGTVVDRLEINVPTRDPKKAYNFACSIWGEPDGYLYKDFVVMWLGDEYNVCLYQADFLDEAVLEIECDSKELREKTLTDLYMIGMGLKRLNESLYSLHKKYRSVKNG